MWINTSNTNAFEYAHAARNQSVRTCNSILDKIANTWLRNQSTIQKLLTHSGSGFGTRVWETDLVILTPLFLMYYFDSSVWGNTEKKALDSIPQVTLKISVLSKYFFMYLFVRRTRTNLSLSFVAVLKKAVIFGELPKKMLWYKWLRCKSVEVCREHYPCT